MAEPARRKPATRTSSFGAGRREGHDASGFYGRNLAVVPPTASLGAPQAPRELDRIYVKSAADMAEVADDSVALMVTSPPYHVGKDYDSDGTFAEYLDLLRSVMAETYRVLEPGGRAVVNVANLGRRPYIPLNAHVAVLMSELGFLMRGEVIWRKAAGASGSCAWGSWRSPSNPTLRDVHEYCLCFSKGDFRRQRKGESTIDSDEFLAATLSVWDIRPESAKRVGHPAPFPVDLPARFIELYTYAGDLVLDPFMGSGSTAVAALRHGRHYIGYETHPEYAAAAEARIEAERTA